MSPNSDTTVSLSSTCVACRNRHLKCDGRKPTCSRCQASSIDCRYVPSRRGVRTVNNARARSEQTRRPSVESSNGSGRDTSTFSICGNSFDTGSQVLFETEIEALDPLLVAALDSDPMDDVSRAIDIYRFPINQGQPTSSLADDPLIQLYYRNFHPSHPFLPPFEFISSTLSRDFPSFLLSMMRAIGAHYGQDSSLFARLRQSTMFSQSSHDSPIERGFQVQYLLLTSIIEHAHGHNECSHRALAQAITLALDIGMNYPSFARQNSLGFCVLEESWRRTYWELYVVNGFIAATRNLDTFTLHEVDCGLPLPCHENEYHAGGAISPQPTLEELQKREILFDERPLSSFSYRIRAVRILGLVLSLNSERRIDMETDVETINAYIAGLYFDIPQPRREFYGVDGKVDEMIFQALMVLHMSTIYLHHPLGNLRLASPQRRISCSQIQQPQCTQINMCGLVQLVPDLHSRKVVEAVDSLLSMVTLSRSIKQTTPFFICAIVVSIIVQVTSKLASGQDPQIKERSSAKIRLGLGALRVLGELWPLAKLSKDELVNLCQAVAL